MRRVHRWLALFVVVAGIYYGSTGVFMQSMDLRALLGHAPATDATMQSIRVGIDGPPNFQVIREPDYAAAALPADFDFERALGIVASAARAALGDAPLSYLELRRVAGQPVGQVASRGQQFGFDATSGVSLGPPTAVIQPPLSLPSLRNTVKDIHRLRVYGRWALAADLVVAATLLAMIVTGVVLFAQLLRPRLRMGRRALYWSGGGRWRSLHRFIGLLAALFLAVIALSGSVLAASSLGVAIRGGVRPGLTVDASSPLQDAELPAMLRTTLAAFRATAPTASIKAVRLRYFGGMPQGIVIAGNDETRQFAFNARTGGVARLSEPGYPDPGVLFGWNVTQAAKKIHRGDAIGLTGRWMDLLAGCALLYLSVSGAVMYCDDWKRRRQRRQLQTNEQVST